MKLSDLPVTLFCDKPNLLTSANGKKGFIESTHIDKFGVTWKQMVVLKWEDGKMSTAHYPDECTNVTVNLEALKYIRPLFVQGLIRDTARQMVGLNELLDSLQE